MIPLLEIVRRNAEFRRKHVDELRKYRDKFVAIYNGGIVSVDEDYLRLLEHLERKEIDPRYVEIEYMPDEDYILVM